MRIGTHGACKAHDPGYAHPDQSRRIEVIETALATVDSTTWSEPSPATRGSVVRVHDEAYLDDLEAFCASGGGAWDPDTVASEHTWDASLASAGIAQWAAEAGINSEPGVKTPFALCRPPGHHAMCDDAMGFCFLNNVAIAAATVIEDGRVSKVGIIDWDVHHANGTQEFVANNDDVALVSLHQAGLYPGTGGHESAASDRCLNLPLPDKLGDADYLYAFEETVRPAMRTFAPDLLLVSCGFDAHEKDVLAGQRMSTDGYGLLAGAVRDLATELDAGIAFVLEGGYALEVLGDCSMAIVDAFAGTVPDRPESSTDPRLETALERARTHPLLDVP